MVVAPPSSHFQSSVEPIPVNTFHFSILAIRKVGLRGFLRIVGLKLYRRLSERRLDNRIRTSRPVAHVPFAGVLPLEPSHGHRFKAAFPTAFADLLSLGQKIRSHRFQFLGTEFQCGATVEWHSDPVTKKEWQKKTYKETALLYEGSPPDTKPVWELNRHQYFVALAQAYHCSGDRAYVDELEAQWLSWIKENPYRMGINWASPLEIGLRLISWTLAFQFIEANLSKESRSAITFSIWQQATFLSSQFSVDKSVRTNHLIGEATGLFIVSSSFAFEESKGWMTAARTVLEQEIHKQVFSDGAGKEQSASYHRFDVDLLLLAHISALKQSAPFSRQFTEQLRKMVQWLYNVQTPGYQLPPFGDCDNGRGFILSPSVDFWDARGLIALGGVVLEDNELTILSFLNDEAFWLLSEQRWNSVKEPQEASKFEPCIVSQEGGHVVIRNAEPIITDYCFFRTGPFGLGGNGFSSHSHADLFSPILFLNGEAILADTGTSVYLGNDMERDYLRSLQAHNTTSSSGWDLFTPLRWFGWEKALDGRIIRKLQTEHEITIECGFEASAGIPYQRTFRYRSGNHSIEIEDLFKENIPDVHSYFHLDPGLKVLRDHNDFVLLKNGAPIVRCGFPDHVKPHIEEGWISRGYGTKEPATIIHFSWNAVTQQSTVFTFTGITR